MRKLFAVLCALSVFTAISSASAAIRMTCDIGTITIQNSDLSFKNGTFIATGNFMLSSRDGGLGWTMMRGNFVTPQLQFTWDGSHKNVLSTEYGDIILTPIAGAPRMDIEFPQPDSNKNGEAVINHYQRMKQQGCILQ